MKLAVSNIAWERQDEDEVLDILAALGVTGVEVAPTRLWPDWTGATPEAAADARTRLAARGLAVPALQSVLFGRPELRLFSDAAGQRALLDHLGRVAVLAEALGARAVVFGSPRNRDPGHMPPEEARDRAAAFFREAADVFQARGTALCIEANPPAYGCRFVTRWREAKALVELVGHPGFGLHLDAACTAMAGDDPAEAAKACGRAIRHFHVSEPQLGGFSHPALDHRRIGEALRDAGYEGWRSIEMRAGEGAPERVREAVEHAAACYA